MRWKLVQFSSLVLAAQLIQAGSCEDPPPPPGAGGFIVGIRLELPPPDQRTLSGGLRETLQGLTALSATVDRIDIVHRTIADDPATEQIITVVDHPQTLELIGNLEDQASRQLGFFNVDPGFVMQVRFIVSEASIQLRGDTLPVKIPSGPQTGLKIEPIDGVPFEVIADQRTGARIVLDPFFQMVRNKGQGFHIKPVMKAEHIAVEDLSPIPLDRVVVKFFNSVSESDINTILGDRNLTVLYRWRPTNYYALRLPASTSLADALEDLDGVGEVEVVLPDAIIDTGVTTPNDPQWGVQSQFTQTNFDDAWDTGTGNFTPIVAIVDSGVDLDHPDLINNIFINPGEIPAAVLTAVGDANGDTVTDFRDIDFNGDQDGILTFADLNSPVNLMLNLCPIANNAPMASCDPLDLVDGTGNATFGWQDGMDNDNLDGLGTFVDDIVGWNFNSNNNLPGGGAAGTNGAHGTEVAGVVGAVGNNMTDIAGANWSTRLLAVQINQSGSGTRFSSFRSSAILGINYAAMLSAHIINLSSGFYTLREGTSIPANCGTGAIVSNLQTDKFDSFRTATTSELAALQLGTSLLVPIAHNCPVNLDSANVFEWPASFKTNQFLVVGSVDSADAMSTFSARGPTVIDLAAPGENYQMLMPGGGNTNACRGTAGDCDGTSYAAPLVSGAAALVLSLNPALIGQPCQLADRIIRNASAVVTPMGSVSGDRRLDADRAVDDAVMTAVRSCP